LAARLWKRNLTPLIERKPPRDRLAKGDFWD
jgi:hypothetical protein